MFDLPDAKRIRRTDLETSPQSSRASTPDPESLALLRSKLSFEEITTTIPAAVPEPVDDNSDEELEFRLFAPSKSGTDATSTAPAQTIRIKSPEVEDTEPGFINPERARSYYFTEVTEVQSREFAAAAVTGEDVRTMAKAPCPGCAYDWKVITLPASQAKAALEVNAVTDAFIPDVERKKKRKGKKLRIKRRQEAEVERKKREEEAMSKEEKEVNERAKRARRNREKKFKKRARDKAKKAAEGGGGDAGVEQDVGSDGDDMSE